MAVGFEGNKAADRVAVGFEGNKAAERVAVVKSRASGLQRPLPYHPFFSLTK